MILDGKQTAKHLHEKLREVIEKLSVKPHLAIVLVGNDPASLIYVKNKIKTAEKLGMKVTFYNLDENSLEKEVLSLMTQLNQDTHINGILLQLPLPKHLNSEKLLDLIDYKKDVDGFHTMNQGLLFQKRNGIRPATPEGIMMLLDHYQISLEGKHVVIIGRSQIVGAPLAKMFLDRNATVTITHSKTKKLAEITKTADILVAAIGSPKFVKADMVKEDVIVIDVGINRLDGKLIGDVDFEAVSLKASYITPVPGGVGPMTICALTYNLLKLYENQKAAL